MQTEFDPTDARKEPDGPQSAGGWFGVEESILAGIVHNNILPVPATGFSPDRFRQESSLYPPGQSVPAPRIGEHHGTEVRLETV